MSYAELAAAHRTVIEAEVRALVSARTQGLDELVAFLDDCAEESGSSVSARVLYEAYAAWARAGDGPVMTETAFGRVASQLLQRRRTKAARSYIGLQLRSAPTA